MATHIKVLIKPTRDGNTESDSTDTLAKCLYDLIQTASSVNSINICRYGTNILCVVHYETS